MNSLIPIPGHHGYLIDRDGAVYREKSPGVLIRMKTHLDRDGYECVTLRVGRAGDPLRLSPRKVHRLVLLAFVGPCPDGHEANHIYGNRADNRIENLEWAPVGVNRATSTPGRVAKRLTHEQRSEAVMAYVREGVGVAKVAARLGVSRGAVTRALAEAGYSPRPSNAARAALGLAVGLAFWSLFPALVAIAGAAD